MSFSVFSATIYFSLISLEVTFEAVRMLIADSSVRMFLLPDNTCNIFSSISASYRLLSADSIINRSFSASRSGRSFLTNIPKS